MSSSRVKDSFGMFQSELTGLSNGTREQMRNKKSVILRSKSALEKDRANSKSSTPIDRSASPQTLFGDSAGVQTDTPLERKVLKSHRRIIESKLKNVRTVTSKAPVDLDSK